MGGRGNSAKQAPPPPEEADAARKRFGNAKSISSSQFNAEDEQSGNNYEKEVRAFFNLKYSLGDLCAGPFQAIPASIERVEKAEKVDFRRQQFLGGQLCIRPNQCVGHFSVPFTSLL